MGLASCLAASAAWAATSSCCAVAFSALSCAQLQLPARQPRPNPRQAALAGLHAVLRWRLRRGPSTCRRLSLTPGTLSSFQMRAVLRVYQVDQFLRALGKRGAMCSCSLSEVACRMVLSCAPKARIHALQVTALMTTSLTPSRQRTPVLGDPASAPCPCPCVRNSCASLHTSKNRTKRTNLGDFRLASLFIRY